MLTLRSSTITLPALAAVAALALCVPAANAQEVGPVDVQGHAPTELRINISGMDTGAVFKAVRFAANTVCGNAVSNRELGVGEITWCRDESSGKAMRRYTAMSRTYPVAALDRVIVLSAR
jgi:hypothetical protein